MVLCMTAETLINRIEINPKVLFGKPVIRGTRISVEQILGMLAGGMTTEEIIEDFPHLTERDIRAAVFYATELIKDFKVYPQEFIHRIRTTK